MVCRVLIRRQIGLLPRQLLPYSLALRESTHYAPPSTCCLLSSRSISSVSSPKGDLLLLSSLRTQAEHENRVSSVQDSLSPPEPFKLVDNLDAREVVLRRTFGVEDIEIVCFFHDETYGENEGEEDLGPRPPSDPPMKMVQMTIKISVGSNEPFLQIVCCTYGNKSSIEQVLLRNHVLKLKEAPYEGPEISLLPP
ncbi:hypothetical protein L7F22_034175 [Adiantum nelumboides]|nr:hypothetical protein [Adiantum nelumboides]